MCQQSRCCRGSLGRIDAASFGRCHQRRAGMSEDAFFGGESSSAVIRASLGQFFCDPDIVGDSGNAGDEPCGLDLPHGLDRLSGNPTNRLVLKWFNPQSLTMFFMPCPIRLGGKSWSNCLSDSHSQRAGSTVRHEAPLVRAAPIGARTEPTGEVEEARSRADL